MARYIDADSLSEKIVRFQKCNLKQFIWVNADVISVLKKEADVCSIEIVRCKDCKHFVANEIHCSCKIFGDYVVDNHFCSYGKKKEGR